MSYDREKKKGRPVLNELEKQHRTYFIQQLKKYSVSALEELFDMMMNSNSQEIKYKCATYILDKCYGKEFVADGKETQDNELVVRLISVPAKEIDFKQAENEIRQVEQNMCESWENDIYYQYL